MSDSKQNWKRFAVAMTAGAGLLTLAALYYRSRNAKVPGSNAVVKPPITHEYGFDIRGRGIHWVIRDSDLKPGLSFLKNVLGMKVLRHEENEKPCEITCNGRYNNSWSKTMIGYDTEDKCYALEVTYNFGVYRYDKGNGLKYIGMKVDDVEASKMEAKKLGLAVKDNVVTNQDGYDFVLMPKEEDINEPFDYVCLAVSDLDYSYEFYTKLMGMTPNPYFDFSSVPNMKGREYKVLSYPSEGDNADPTSFVLVQADEPLNLEEFEGRNALTFPSEHVKAIYEAVKAYDPSRIVHSLEEHHPENPLGALYIGIIQDPDGYSICLVSDQFNAAALGATDYKEPDWEWRREFIDKKAKKSDKGRSS